MATALVVVHPPSPWAHVYPIAVPIVSSPIVKPFAFSAEFKFKHLQGRRHCTVPLFRCCSSKNEQEDTQQLLQERFSMLESDVPWGTGRVWSTMGLYLFSLHIPLNFGGLSVLSQFLRQPNLAPDIKALSVLGIQSLELFSTLILLRVTSKREYDLVRLLMPEKLRNERNWFLPSLLGFVLLLFIIFLTSYLADSLVGSKDVNDQVLKEILSSGPVSITACIQRSLICRLQEIDPKKMSCEEKLTFWINIHDTLVVYTFLPSLFPRLYEESVPTLKVLDDSEVCGATRKGMMGRKQRLSARELRASPTSSSNKSPHYGSNKC